MTKYVTEILKEISDNPILLSTTYKGNQAIEILLRHAFDVRGKFLLPDGIPPYKKDAAPLGMSPGNFYQQIKKFYIFCRKDVNKTRREQLFIQLLESLHPSEAEVCVAVKDQNITRLYPGITVDVMLNAGLVEQQYSFRHPEVQRTSEGKQYVVNLSDTAVTGESFGKAPPESNNVAKKRGRPPGTKKMT